MTDLDIILAMADRNRKYTIIGSCDVGTERPTIEYAEQLKAENEGLRAKGNAFLLADWQFAGNKVPHQFFEFRDALKENE